MHELSLAQNLIEELLVYAEEHNAEEITKAALLLGPFSGVVADSLTFGFNILKKEHAQTKNTELVIEIPTPTYRCRKCGEITIRETTSGLSAHQYQLTGQIPCEHCGTIELTPEGGNELILQQLEME